MSVTDKLDISVRDRNSIKRLNFFFCNKNKKNNENNHINYYDQITLFFNKYTDRQGIQGYKNVLKLIGFY